MQFHHHGYVSGDPRVRPAPPSRADGPGEIGDEVDVLIVGAGPAGHIAAAQLAQFPNVTTRLIERRPGRLEVGQADGIQARSVETFQAFGFAAQLSEEAYRITAMAFWGPSPDGAHGIVRMDVAPDDPANVSEFPHLIVNQARVQDHFITAMWNAPGRLRPDYGIEFLGLRRADTERSHPIEVRLRHHAGPHAGEERVISARYVIGADGARSRVRDSIGARLSGEQAMHAWGVMDLLAVTDFPDIRMKCAIQSHDGGSILLIPREGGYLFRMYVDLGDVGPDDRHVRETSLEEIVARANVILHPYSLDVRSVAWHSVYEVAHRLADRFDDAPQAHEPGGPRVFIVGDACHTHSAKAGQGMNVSLQDGWNIGWKLGHVLDGRASPALLATYARERQVVARDLIDFDREWSSLMAAKPGERDQSSIAEFYSRTFEFPAGFLTDYQPSLVIGTRDHQQLAPGFPVGRRFRSATVVRVCDANPIHLGHQATADGRWRLYVFADAGQAPAVARLADWAAASRLGGRLPSRVTISDWFDIKIIYPARFDAVDLGVVPDLFRPRVGPFGLIDHENVFAAGPGPDGGGDDIFEVRGIGRTGAIVVVRPDQYVATVLPVDATDELGDFLAGFMPRPE